MHPNSKHPVLADSFRTFIGRGLLQIALVTSLLFNISLLKVGRYEPAVSGNMAEWLGAVGTIAAFSVALGAVHFERKSQNELRGREAAAALAIKSIEAVHQAAGETGRRREAKVQLAIAGAARLDSPAIDTVFEAIASGSIGKNQLQELQAALLDVIANDCGFAEKSRQIPAVWSPLLQ